MKKVIAFLLIFIGLGVMVYPKAVDLYSAQKQNNLIEDWENQEYISESTQANSNSSNEDTAKNSYINLDSIFNPAAGTAEAAEPDSIEESRQNTEEVEETESAEEESKPLSDSMLGIITIDKINVKLPILRSASQYHLKYGAGHLSGTVLPGQKGNSAIAAHRSREYGKMFNRLNEVSVGDAITVNTRDGSYTYKVTDTKIVKPEDLSVLNNTTGETLTLITCDTPENPVNRLIIKAQLK
ncbi:class D sortase [Rossellomorea vietnamensis]|uniref:Class D sortase n=1 Tax=Rossellomorea vietnamensis TaxID=218284 RepID=A0A5D4KGK9_9BACI|nr:class D sortase [Rossellomorea vietnamensis]TYR75990.1 class D sortase [Rossellomorea vietnamensis]